MVEIYANVRKQHHQPSVVYTIFVAHFKLRMLIPMIKRYNLVRPLPLLSILLLILSTPILSKLNQYL